MKRWARTTILIEKEGAAHAAHHFAQRWPLPVRTPLHTYRLKFFDDDKGSAKEIEFDAFDAAQALIIAHNEASDRSAELWCDSEKLCTIRRRARGIWEIGGSAAHTGYGQQSLKQ